jgi:hypothetical protein
VADLLVEAGWVIDEKAPIRLMADNERTNEQVKDDDEKDDGDGEKQSGAIKKVSQPPCMGGDLAVSLSVSPPLLSLFLLSLPRSLSLPPSLPSLDSFDALAQ